MSVPTVCAVCRVRPVPADRSVCESCFPTRDPKGGCDVADESTAGVWAVVELMGHVRLAGRLTEEEKFGAKMGRLDIPTGDGCGGESDNWCPKCGRCTCPDPAAAKDDPGCPLHAPASKHATAPAFVTQFFGGGSVYRITVVSEEVARHVARGASAAPVQPWDFPKQLSAAPAVGRPPTHGGYPDHDDDQEYEDRSDDRDDDYPI